MTDEGIIGDFIVTLLQKSSFKTFTNPMRKYLFFFYRIILIVTVGRENQCGDWNAGCPLPYKDYRE